MRWAWFIHRSLGVFVIQDQPKPTLRSWRMAQLGIAGWKKMFGEGRSAVVNASPRSYRVSVARLLLESLEKKNVCLLKQKVGQLCECVRLKNNQRCYRLICQAPLPTKSTVRVQSLCWNLPYWNMPLTLGHCDRMSRCTTTEQTKQLRKVLADERSPMQGFLFFLQKVLEVWGLPTQICPTFNRLQLCWDQTHLYYSPGLLTNKGNGALRYPSPEEVALERKGKKELKLFNKSRFIWSTDKEKWRSFFFFPPPVLELHMTAIWRYCVFWPKRVVYDRWQERKSQAAGLSTDMQIAFSWLQHTARYLSSGLQCAFSFIARKQLINSTVSEEEGELTLGGGRKTPKWPEN